MPSVLWPVADTEHSFVSLEFNLNGFILTGFTSLGYGDTLEWAEIEASTGQVVAHARGGYKSKDLTFELHRSQWDAFLAAQPDNWRLQSFPATALRRTPGLVTSTDRIIGCRFKDIDVEASAGSASGLTVKKTCVTRGVMWNGKKPFPEFKE